jgi:GGDEF domain-containing protein
LQRELKKLANSDPLTGLLNRRGVVERASDNLSTHDQKKRPVAALFVDHDHDP